MRLTRIEKSKNAVNENDGSRKRFMVMARDVFGRFKACVHMQESSALRDRVDAVKIVYKSLVKDAEQADIRHILKALHEEVDAAIKHADGKPGTREESPLYDISQIDFEKLAQEFQRSKKKNAAVQNLKAASESRLARLLALNPMRKDLQARFEEIVNDYNREKDRVTIETSFQQLLVITNALNDKGTACCITRVGRGNAGLVRPAEQA